jgi:hypothetical protein
MEVLLILALLIGLWLLIRNDRNKVKTQAGRSITRSEMERGFKPRESSKWLPPLGIALICSVFFVKELLHPSQPPFEGRWGWLWSSLRSAAGTFGLAAYWGLAATVAAFAAALTFRKARRGTKQGEA